ncbi:methyltransferase [Echinicola sediminis]
MANSYFQFKQFTIHQEHCAMKVSTDAVIIGALAHQNQPGKILDIGTGTGVITLMLAQRFEGATIQAVEIDEAAALQAGRNISNSPWKDRINIFNQRFQDFIQDNQERFPLIVSNPPYFPKHNKSKDAQRNLALHNDGLPFGDLIKGIVKLLDREKGKFWVILPPQQMRELEKIARFFELYPQDSYELKDRPSTKVLREIKAFSFHKTEAPHSTSICIKNDDFSFSEVYQQLLKDFLLIF